MIPTLHKNVTVGTNCKSNINSVQKNIENKRNNNNSLPILLPEKTKNGVFFLIVLSFTELFHLFLPSLYNLIFLTVVDENKFSEVTEACTGPGD